MPRPIESPRQRLVRQALDRHEARLLAYAARCVGGVDAARDIVQEAFLRLCRVETPPPDDALRPWLYRVCRNLAIDHLRKEGRMHALEHVQQLTDPATAEHEPYGSNPASHAEHAEETVRLLACVADLPARQQEVVRLRFQDALSYRDIAVVTGASVSHVGVLLHDAMHTLRRRLAAAPCERSHS
ncbi:MAG: RNA polymerase sigma factor [Planctomycetota bacterium]|nr:RNA polymerase sigma factor [Planctomycetota bacterium]